MKTFSPTPKDITHNWYVVDASDKILGRLASAVAVRLRGKHKVEYAPAHGHRRFHRRGQCRQDPRHRP